MKYEFPFEQAAMRGEVPDDMSIIDTGTCYLLGQIYKKFRESGGKSNDAALRKARIAKDKLRRDYEFQTQTAVQLTKIWRDSEFAAIEYRKNPTKENMDRLQRVIHNMMDLTKGGGGNG